MGRKRVPGLIMRSGIWHIDKCILGKEFARVLARLSSRRRNKTSRE